jgi:hypothetical protein
VILFESIIFGPSTSSNSLSMVALPFIQIGVISKSSSG